MTEILQALNLDLNSIEEEIIVTKKKIVDLKIKLILKEEKRSHLIKIQKKRLAQLLTIKHKILLNQ